MKKYLRIICIVMFFLAISIIFSNSTNADKVELKSISFNDSNLYYALKEKIASSITSYNDETLTINIYSNILETITDLNLSNKNITDLKGIENFSKLRSLYISGCKIKNIKYIPYENLTNLKISNVNEIEDFSYISNFRKLYNLEITDGCLDKIPEEIYELNNTLHYLTIKNNKLENITSISNLSNLTNLDISGNKITNITPICDLTNIKTLNISNNRIEDISSLSNLKLINFYAENNKISDISALKDMSLSYLNLKNNNIKDINSIDMSKMKSLDLSYNSISDFSNIPLNNTEYKLNNQLININVSDKENIELPNIIDQAITNFKANKIETDNCTISADYKECSLENNTTGYARIKIAGGRMDNTIIYLDCDNENISSLTVKQNSKNSLNSYMICIIIGCVALICILIIIYIIRCKKVKSMEV